MIANSPPQKCIACHKLKSRQDFPKFGSAKAKKTCKPCNVKHKIYASNCELDQLLAIKSTLKKCS